MNKTTIITALVMLGIGAGIGFWFSPQSTQPGVTVSVNAGESDSKKVLFYRNAMNPSVTSPVPAKDSMGMDYVPVYADGNSGSDSAGTVTIDPVVVQNIGVRTAFAVRKTFGRVVRAAGRVDFDEERIARLHPKIEGWIEEIMVDKTGQSVDKDDVLLGIYSPRLVSTQQEYLLALNSLTVLEDSPIKEIRRGAQEMVDSARERLELFDVPDHQIRELEESRKIKKMLHIHTPVSGTVIKIGSRQGQYVTPNTELFMIVDLSHVWVYADVYDYELPWIREGDTVEMTLVSVPDKVFSGTLSYIYPYAESKTRTTKVRLLFNNPELLLRPDMFAEVTIHSETRENAIVIPSEAVLRSGDQTQIFVKRGPGKFEPKQVRLGVESGGEVAVLAGVNEGDEVVTSSQYLLDSESSLREATAKMMEAVNGNGNGKSAEEDTTTEDTDHSTMDMTEPQQSMDMKGMDMQGMDMKDMDMQGMDMKGMDMEGMDKQGMDMQDMDMQGMDMSDERAKGSMSDHGNHSND
jgi:membrane fusion protein, copper/silver efflux system